MPPRRVSRPIDEADTSTEGRGHLALITGASSGIGRSHAELLAAKGFGIVPVARRHVRLRELQADLEARWGVEVNPIVADLADPAAPAAIVRELEARGKAVDFLVNNAGYSMVGPYAETRWQDQERYLRVMCIAVAELTHRVLPSMVARRWGRIITVSSIAATFRASPNTVLYSATKAMVNRLTEGIASECAGQGVHCTVSMPGFTATELLRNAGVEDSVLANPLMRRAQMSPERIAREAYSAVMAGRRSVVHGKRHRLVTGLVTFTPSPVSRQLSERFMSVLAKS